jgi:hypothetical protein
MGEMLPRSLFAVSDDSTILLTTVEQMLHEHGVELNPLAIIGVGSWFRSRAEARDIDIICIYKNYHEKMGFLYRTHGDKKIELHMIHIDKIRSYWEQYYWYPWHLALEYGKYSTYVKLWFQEQPCSDLTLLDQPPPMNARLFLLCYHTGSLLKHELGLNSKRGEWIQMSRNASIVSIVASVLNTFPHSAYLQEVISQGDLGTRVSEIIDAIEAEKNNYIGNIVGLLRADAGSEMLEALLKYEYRYPEDFMGFEALIKHISGGGVP